MSRSEVHALDTVKRRITNGTCETYHLNMSPASKVCAIHSRKLYAGKKPLRLKFLFLTLKIEIDKINRSVTLWLHFFKNNLTNKYIKQRTFEG